MHSGPTRPDLKNAGRAGGGRFAPSPTGPLHFGSLLTAVASFLDARSRGDRWYLRLDDLDRPRNAPGADTLILHALDAHGLHWDGPVQRQSEHREAYLDALLHLEREGLLFHCRCSRADLQGLAAYPGTCRAQRRPVADSAVRIRLDDGVSVFADLVRGPQHRDLAIEGGDFVVRRRDRIIAYPLATAVDDGAPAITRVIRGSDLLESTHRQIHLMRLLDLTVPEYGHVPLLLNTHGQKLSKQNLARPVDPATPAGNLVRVLDWLNLPVAGTGSGPCPGGPAPPCEELLRQALPHWSLAALPRADIRGSPGTLGS